MSKYFKPAIVAALLLAFFTLPLFAVDAPAAPGKNLIKKALAVAGKPAPDLPKKFILEKQGSVVAIGDSITEFGGYLRKTYSAMAELYPDLELHRIINKGISGQKAEELIQRFPAAIKNKPDVITISIGINDVWHRMGAPHDEKILKKYKENIARMVDMAQEIGVKVILLTPTLIMEDANSPGNKRLLLYVNAMKEVQAEKKCGLSDLHALFLEALKHKPADITGNWLTKDGVHMTPIGDALMAVGVLRALGVSDEALARLK